MEDIIIEKTSKTPAVDFKFKEGILEIKGVSIPEDADSFYAPLLEWVNDYIENKETSSTKVLLKLIYFNTSTSDYLVTMLKNLKKLIKEEPEGETESAAANQAKEDEDDQPNRVEEPSEENTISEKHNLEIEWYYEEDDEDMRETGSHFESIIDLPFTFQACEEIS